MPADSGCDPGVLLAARGVARRYPPRGRSGVSGSGVAALDGVDLTLRAGAFSALVGQSGSGKSTLSRCLTALERPDAGTIDFEGIDASGLTGPALRAYRRRAQLVVQDPGRALNPRFLAWEAVAEPLVVQGGASRRERREQAVALMERVGLSADLASRRSLHLSGGQRQRLAIARALAAEPRLIVLDEALTGLDPSLQAQVLNLLRDLQEERALTYLLVSHDLALVASVADEVAVLHAGRIVERGDPAGLVAEPRHPHTRALVAAASLRGPGSLPEWP